MPRPPRCRRICGAPQVDTFCPNGCENTEPILLTLDEYEVINNIGEAELKNLPLFALSITSRTSFTPLVTAERVKNGTLMVCATI